MRDARDRAALQEEIENGRERERAEDGDRNRARGIARLTGEHGDDFETLKDEDRGEGGASPVDRVPVGGRGGARVRGDEARDDRERDRAEGA